MRHVKCGLETESCSGYLTDCAEIPGVSGEMLIIHRNIWVIKLGQVREIRYKLGQRGHFKILIGKCMNIGWITVYVETTK